MLFFLDLLLVLKYENCFLNSVQYLNTYLENSIHPLCELVNRFTKSFIKWFHAFSFTTY